MRHRHLWAASGAEVGAWPARERDPLADLSERQRRGIVGTAAAIAIGAGLFGGTTAAGIYSSRSAANVNRRSIDAQERSDQRAADLEAQRLAEERRQYDAAVQRDRERWADYTRVWEPHWQMGQGVLGSLYNMAGLQPGAPGPSAPSALPPGTGGAAPTSASLADLALQPDASGVFAMPPASGSTLPVTSRHLARSQRPRRPIQPMAEMPTPRGMGLSELMALADMAGTAGNPNYNLPLMAIPRV